MLVEGGNQLLISQENLITTQHNSTYLEKILNACYSIGMKKLASIPVDFKYDCCENTYKNIVLCKNKVEVEKLTLSNKHE